MRRPVLLLLLMATAVGVAPAAQNESADLPQRIIANIAEPPSSSLAITWRMAQAYDDASVEYAVATAGIAFTTQTTLIPATLERAFTEKSIEVFHYSAVLKRLLPGTRYVYRVGRPEAWSEWTQISTARAQPAAVSFVWFGDPQDELRSHCSRVFREAFKTAPQANFWLFSGDLTSEPEDAQIGGLFAAGGMMFGMVPIVMAPGNHDMAFRIEDGKFVLNEKGRKQRLKTISPLWRAHYTLPQNGPQGLEETAFSFDYQGVRIIMLNSSDRLEDQARWMEPLLTTNPNRWTVVAFHHPIYSSGRERDDRETRTAFRDLFDRYAVDLVLNGHDHTYARSLKLRQDKVVAGSARGTVYVNSSSGPKAYAYNPLYRPLMAKTAVDTQLFQVINIDAKRLTYRAYTAAGSLFDEFELRK